MLGLIVALAAAAPTVIDAEHAFAQMAQDKGQWTAFRAYAAPDAVMFTPQPVNAQQFLKDKIDPLKAIRWQPTHAWVSCDGTLAVDTGNWQSADGNSAGYFTTVWKRQANGSWKWVYDGGEELKIARPAVARPSIAKAACNGKLSPVLGGLSPQHYSTHIWQQSSDRSLEYSYSVGRGMARSFYAAIFDGKRPRRVIEDQVSAAK